MQKRLVPVTGGQDGALDLVMLRFQGRASPRLTRQLLGTKVGPDRGGKAR